MSYKIFHFVSSLNIGGAERFALDLAITQKSIGHEVEIISTGSHDDFLVKEAYRLKIPVNIMPSGRMNIFRRILCLFRANEKTILHVHSPYVLLLLAPILLIIKSYGVKLIYTRHGSDPLAKLKWFISHRWARYFVNQATFVSQSGLDVFHNNHRWPKSSLSLIKNGVLIPPLQKTDIDNVDGNKKILRIGLVGRLVSIKAQIHLLQAASSLSQEEKKRVEIHIYGDGPDRAMLGDYVEKSLTDVKVFFYGMVLDRERIYSSIDLLIMCSETEGLSMSIMEAMARNVPVIATDVGDSAKLVLPEVTGSLYQYGDTDKLAKLVKRYMLEVDDRVKQGESAKNHIQANYSILETAELYNECYDR